MGTPPPKKKHVREFCILVCHFLIMSQLMPWQNICGIDAKKKDRSSLKHFFVLPTKHLQPLFLRSKIKIVTAQVLVNNKLFNLSLFVMSLILILSHEPSCVKKIVKVTKNFL